MEMNHHTVSAIALGIGLGACCGFRVFIPLLIAAIAAQNQWVVLAPDMHWLGSEAAIVIFAIGAVVEVSAYYFPFLDNIIDTFTAPLAVAAGLILAAALLPIPIQEPLVRWGLALVAGGLTAGTIHVGTGIWRLFSTKATLGTGNAVLATGENAVALAAGIGCLFIPVIVSVLMLVIVGWFASREIIGAGAWKSNLR
jgi:hypothetical protein